VNAGLCRRRQASGYDEPTDVVGRLPTDSSTPGGWGMPGTTGIRWPTGVLVIGIEARHERSWVLVDRDLESPMQRPSRAGPVHVHGGPRKGSCCSRFSAQKRDRCEAIEGGGIRGRCVRGEYRARFPVGGQRNQGRRPRAGPTDLPVRARTVEHWAARPGAHRIGSKCWRCVATANSSTVDVRGGLFVPEPTFRAAGPRLSPPRLEVGGHLTALRRTPGSAGSESIRHVHSTIWRSGPG